MLSPGRKSKEISPAELHLRLPDDIRGFLNNVEGPNAKEKIISILREASQQQIPEDLEPLRMRIKDLVRERIRIQNAVRKHCEILERHLPDPEQRDAFFEQITEEVLNEEK